jgi:hypothetical protein
MVSDPKPVTVVCLPKLQPAYLVESATIEGSSIEMGGTTFRDSGAGDWLGFYDWLRTSDNEVIGVRQYVDPDPKVDQILLSLQEMTSQSTRKRVQWKYFSQPAEIIMC